MIAGALEPGSPYPLGSTFDGLGVNFAVFSAHATRVELCLFDATGKRQLASHDLPEWTDEVWHGYLPGARPGQLYGFRAHGPYAPHDGHRFNPHKLLIDPYARKLEGRLRWTDGLHAYNVRSSRRDLSFDRRDSARAIPKSVVTHERFDWSHDERPRTPWPETVIYEAHVKGLTKLLSDVPPNERGTYAALAHPSVIEHLKRLGVTALELLPIHAFTNDRFLQEKGLSNYWGYNTLSYFAPQRGYFASENDHDELRIAVRRLHAAGIEVILDVVYNHTAEGSELGPTLSWRGLDNATYYRLAEEDARHLVNDTGTGNTLNLSRARVVQMVMDSLRYWATSYGIDGFRFDLGTVLGRTDEGFRPNAPLFAAIRQDPVLQKLKLIAEPWDIGPGGYQLGNYPPGFAEWNDRYRDTVRRYWRGDSAQRPELAARLAGSGDLFDRRARRPWASVNFLTSHDGYTLADLTAYEKRHNEANKEHNRDGHDHNFTRNWGAEGPTRDKTIRETRALVRRSMLVTLFGSLGTPMLLGGDEFARTQRGNNNAYCQDNAINWFDWEQARSEEGEALTRFVARLAEMRRRHPVLRSAVFLHGNEEAAEGLPDIDWWDERGVHLEAEDWDNGEGRALLMRRAERQADGSVVAVSLLMNASEDPLTFHLPPPDVPRRLLIDSAHPDAAGNVEVRDTYLLKARAAALLEWRQEAE
ncbi:glycogen debranching protein GlgX [Erythrobacter sp. HL-111]|uniref:glycogen debranching protein GlgX n=1 Tax=Erythrobacter sp. HL-111 TaxID=1798193 RepID=UPI0006D9609F|nr:glycogen debranching protein GlgX [Erythrobacter sp. HL-111]KPP88768.1 MAG: glycogen debranching enzyme TreX [Erythrobacteraceae bacterium HL-111]SDR95906.1 glycogen operon protein [Erythrobacter sp. HL-111]